MTINTDAETRMKGRTRLITALLTGALVAVLFGSQNIVIWVEDWPPSPMTDEALEAALAWKETADRLHLADLHPWLRQAERSLEGTGIQD